MFVGHYAVAFAARGARPALPLWQLFVAVQLVDFVWAGLVLAGVEKIRIVPGYMEASPLDLHHMPYSHSLVAVVIWALAAGSLRAAFGREEVGARPAGMIVAAAVFSHWLGDLLVHPPDLALWQGGPKLGLGLWDSMLWTQVVEIGGLFVGAAIYLAHTRPKGRWGKSAPALLLGVMLALHLASQMPLDPLPSIPQFALMSLLLLSALVVGAWLVDRTREPAMSSGARA